MSTASSSDINSAIAARSGQACETEKLPRRETCGHHASHHAIYTSQNSLCDRLAAIVNVHRIVTKNSNKLGERVLLLKLAMAICSSMIRQDSTHSSRVGGCCGLNGYGLSERASKVPDGDVAQAPGTQAEGLISVNENEGDVDKHPRSSLRFAVH